MRFLQSVEKKETNAELRFTKRLRPEEYIFDAFLGINLGALTEGSVSAGHLISEGGAKKS